MLVRGVEKALRSATRVLVVRGSAFDPTDRTAQEVLADVRNEAAIDRLRSAIAASETDAALMTPGDPTIVVLRKREVLLTVQRLGAGYIRTSLATGDLQLDDPEALDRWLSEQVERS